MTQEPTGNVALKFEPQKPYIERRGTEQVVNFDLLVRNQGNLPLRINKIQVSVYDRAGDLAFRRYLDENGRPSGISTLPDRIVPAGGSLDVFNPFYCFDEEMPLTRLHYEIFFDRPDQREPNMLTFITKAEADVYPISYSDKIRLVLPLKGRIYVFDGHDFYAHHRRQSVFVDGHFRPNRVRFAYDLMITNASGDLYRGDPSRKEDWLSYGKPVFAPAAGIVVDVANDIPENSYKNRQVVYPTLPANTDTHGLGNHVIIDHGDGEFSGLHHLQPGSVRVKKGDHVGQGEQIGAVGFSGDTFLPHLDYSLIDSADEGTARGLPSYFDDFRRILGSRSLTVSHGQIDSGEIIESPAPK